jgi:hypothetical protein
MAKTGWIFECGCELPEGAYLMFNQYEIASKLMLVCRNYWRSVPIEE